MEKFLNLKSVRNALGVGNINFVSCSPTVYQAMLTDWMRDLEVGIPDLVNNGVKLLVYAGEYDLICNWLGEFPTGIKTLRYFYTLIYIYMTIYHTAFQFEFSSIYS